MTTPIKGKTIIPKEDDCNCGKPLKINDPRRKIIRKIQKKF